MPRVALINYHIGSIAVSEALFRTLGYEVVSITTYSHHRTMAAPEVRYKILRGICNIYALLKLVNAKLFKKIYTKNGYPAPLILYRFLTLLGIVKDEDYIAAVMVKSFGLLEQDSTPQQIEHFSQSCSNNPVFKRFFRDVDCIVTSFPPRLAHFARIFADRFNVRLIILSGHRFNLRVNNPAENELIKKNLLEAHQNPRHILASASFYDLMYTQHYLNIKSEPLFNFSFHITQKIEHPDNNIVLIGPVNVRAKPIKKFEHAYTQFCDDNNLTPKFVFRFIRSVYPTYYRLIQLARHPAVIILPYSVFSYSQEELYDLNIPFFVPSVDFLIQSGMVNDRVLYDPPYISLNSYKAMEADFEDDGSPNCRSEAAQRKWLSYSSFYQRENTVIFNDFTDLARKIHTIDQDGDRIRQKMYAENVKRRDENLKLWTKVLNIEPGGANG